MNSKLMRQKVVRSPLREKRELKRGVQCLVELKDCANVLLVVHPGLKKREGA